MSKATITLEYVAGQFHIDCEFEPAATHEMTYEDHPAAYEALRMLNYMKNGRVEIAEEEEVEIEEEWMAYDE